MKKDDVLITVYTHHIKGRDIQIVFSEDIFLDGQPEVIGKAVINAWKLMIKDRPPNLPKPKSTEKTK